MEKCIICGAETDMHDFSGQPACPSCIAKAIVGKVKEEVK